MSVLDQFCGSPLWDTNLTWNTTDPDFTPCFQKTVLVWVPCLFLWTLMPLEVLLLKKFHRRPLNKNFLNQSKLVLLVSISITQIIDYTYIVYHHYEGIHIPSVDFYTPVIYFVTFALCLILHIIQFKVGRHNSGILFLFWFVLNLCNVVKFRTAVRTASHNPNYSSSLPFITFEIYFGCCLVELILSVCADVSQSVRTQHAKEKCSAEETASFLSRITFSWFDRFAWTGFRRPITPDDLWTLRHEYKTATVNERFEQVLSKEIEKSKRTNKYHTLHNHRTSSFPSIPQPGKNKVPHQISLAKVLLRTFGVTFFTFTNLKVMADLCGLASPLLLQQLIAFVESNNPFWQGMLYVTLLSVSALMQSLFINQCYDGLLIMCLQLKSALISSIYKKSLKISNTSKNTLTVGEIVNLMSVDAQRMSEMMMNVPLVFTAPIQLGIAVYMMYRVLGVSALIGLCIMLLLGPINAVLARKIEKLQLLIMELKDKRIKIMNEILAGMKVLKLYAWEPSFCDNIGEIRKKEMEAMKKLVYMNSCLWIMFNCAPYLISLTMFTSYVFIEGNDLDATTAFVSLSLLQIIQEPLSFAPIMIAAIIQMRVSIKRLNDFMNLEELDDEQIKHEHTADVIKVENATFAWEVSGEPILSDISFTVPKGTLVAMVGIVGAGKSSLLMALLGEMEKYDGKVNTYGNIAYVPQIAWIQNATLLNNILFGKEMDKSRYEVILDACALRPDLEVLPGGDLTEIGEKGINLSGGQKQRVSLGRAVYNDAEIYLLDDPLSAVDSHVGKHIFDQVIGPNGLLKEKTRILVTHGMTHLSEVDTVIVMDNGKIVEIGTYTELIDKKGALYEFINSTQREEENDPMNDEEMSTGDIMNARSSFSQKGMNERFARQVSTVSLSSEDGMVDTKYTRQISYPEIEPGKPLKGNLISEETVETGRVDWGVYFHYFKALGKKRWFITMVVFAATWGISAGTNLWLSKWTNDNDPTNIPLRNLRLGVYGGLSALLSLLMFVGYILAGLVTLRAAQVLHNNMLHQVLRAPMSFFDVTPLGRIINRFSHDIDTADSILPNMIIALMETIFRLIGTIVVICIGTPIIAAVLFPVGVIYYFTQKFYISTSRQLKRLASNFRSPIYSHFSETLSGLAVIRAFKVQDAFVEKSNSKVDQNHKAVYPSYSSRLWLSVRLDFFGNVIIFFCALFSVLNRHTIDPGTLGLTVSYAMTITFVFNWLAKSVSEIEMYIVSVERIKEYSETQSEDEWEKLMENIDPNWPNKGVVAFENYSTRYREGLDLVLKGISCDVKSGEKIGIVGRTGAGKSSLTLALFRLVEAADGKILIDNVNISTLGLHTVRSRLTIIPQDPVLFCGTLRMNLDPFEKYNDQQIWYALEHSHLKQFVSGLEKGLQHEVTEGGENLSVGQRQLLCLARALLRKSKVLILDEATAAVDLETDDLIQATIRKEFADCTVFTIAHRLNTIMDNTRILVLKNGLIEEFDTPTNLLQNTKSIFYSMAKDAGLV